MNTKTLLAGSLLLLTALSASMFGDMLTVAGTSNIFAAGLGSVSAGQGGTLPTMFGGLNGTVIRFNSVSGSVSCGFGCPGSNGADGFGYYSSDLGPTLISSQGNGISGIQFSWRDFFLVGAFLDNNSPSVAPSDLVYDDNTANNSLTFQPALGQVFYIGDGLTGFNDASGTRQSFFVPQGATRLFLGFADAQGFVGTPGWYFDNTGSFTVDLTVANPEPGTITLMGLGVTVFALVRYRRLAHRSA